MIGTENLSKILPAVLSNINKENIELTTIAMKAFGRAAPITHLYFSEKG